MRTKRRLIAAKIEAVEGTPENLTATETGVLAIDPKYSPDLKLIPRNLVVTTLSKAQDLIGQRLAHISFRAELYGRAAVFAANNLPVLSPFLRACGLAETLDVTPGSEFVEYKPASSGFPSLTLGLYTDGVLKKISGARGTVKISATAGQPFYADFDFLGAYIAPTDVAMLTPSYVNLIPPQFLSALFAVGAYSPVMKSFELGYGIKLTPREDANAASGYKSFEITDRDVRAKFDPEETLVASHNWWSLWTGGTSAALSIGPVGPAQYNKVKVSAPKLVYTKIAEADREGYATLAVDGQCAMNTGDDEAVLRFE